MRNPILKVDLGHHMLKQKGLVWVANTNYLNMHLQYQLASWAKNNRKSAIFCIGVIITTACLIYFELGIFLAANNIVLPVVLLLPIILTISGLTYFQKKSWLYPLAGFLLWVMLGNHLGPLTQENKVSEVIQISSVVYPVKPIEKVDKSVKRGIRKIFKKRKQQFKEIGQNITPAGAFFLFFFLGLAAIALAFLLATISCSLSCNGNAVGAALVFAVAIATTLGGLFLIGYAIYRAASPNFRGRLDGSPNMEYKNTSDNIYVD